MALLPTAKVSFRGVTVDARTRAAVLWAEKQLGFELEFSQGSFRPYTSYSGSTHTGPGALDARVNGFSSEKITRIVKVLRNAGFAAWSRDSRDGFAPHIHMILLDCSGLPSGARWQVYEYDRGRSGLTNGKPDRIAYRPAPKVKFSWLLRKPVRR
jgi:hypothetical protein